MLPPDLPILISRTRTLETRTGTWRSARPRYVQRTPPCREACPAGEDVASWIDLLREREHRAAWEVLVEDNPFPATMGRICVHPCERACNRGNLDHPMAINALEQFLGDRALAERWPLPGPGGERPQAVAVVGAGLAGLSCAYQLRRLGYRVHVFEAAPEAGGMLLHALPEYQLPPAVVEAEVARILELGIHLHAGVRVGAPGDVGWEELLTRFQAVLMAVGAPSRWPAGIAGEELAGALDALDFLRRVRHGLREAPGRRCVVIGAGLSGLEAARTLRRLGAAAVVLAPEAKAGHPLPDRAEEASAEGAEIVWEAAVSEIRRAASGFQVEARIAGQSQRLPCDAVLLATGRAVDLEALPGACEIDGNGVKADPFTAETGIAGLFAAGDVTGTRYAVEAAGAGKRAAAAIDSFLQGRAPREGLGPHQLGYSPNLAMRAYARPGSYPSQVRVELWRVVTFEEITTDYFPPAPRRERAALPPAERLAGFAEVRRGFAAEEAATAALRCFSCGTCIHCDNCLIFCPDMAIAHLADGRGYEVDLDYCKGCGACAAECPRSALVMEGEAR